ncbi:Heparanase-like protein 1 [Linum grandiflorum]
MLGFLIRFAAFDPLRIRVGGSLEDLVVYKVGKAIKKFPKFKKLKDGMFGCSRGTLTMKRWDDLNQLFSKTNTKVIFGLNALIGKRKKDESSTLWVGDWNPQNARDFMNYTVQKGYKIDSYEFGNELSGSGVSARVEPEQYAKDTIRVRKAVNELYPDPNSRPLVLGPAGFFDMEWFKKYLQAVGPNVVDGVTHHIYNLGAGVDSELINKVQDPFFLDQVAQTFKDVQDVVEQSGTLAAPWVGESGGAFNSGGKDVSNTFANGFWYLDQLGMTSTFGHKAYCRQSLVGGNYGLLRSDNFAPNPDYYGALLWHRLMGNGVLRTIHDGSPYLRAYSHCSKKNSGVTLMLINMSNSTTFNVWVTDDLNLYQTTDDSTTLTEDREEYHLTPEGGNIQSDVVQLNGIPLKLKSCGEIPNMDPKLVPASSPVTVAPDSFVYVNIKDFKAPAC